MADDVEVPDSGTTDLGSVPESSGDLGAETPQAVAPALDLANLPDELKPHWERMTAAHAAKLEEIRAKQADIDLVARYRSDPNAAKEFITSEARRLGLSLNEARAVAAEATQPTGETAPAHIVQAIQAQLGPELAWMAQPMANAQWAATRLTAAPIAEKQRQQEMSQRQSEYEALAGQLTTKAPGWEAKEADMLSLFDFLQSPKMTDRRWGSKLELLHSLVDGGESATTGAMRRMAEAVKNRTTTGQSTRTSVTNISDRVRGAKNLREAMEIASTEAARELKAAGVAIPD